MKNAPSGSAKNPQMASNDNISFAIQDKKITEKDLIFYLPEWKKEKIEWEEGDYRTYAGGIFIQICSPTTGTYVLGQDIADVLHPLPPEMDTYGELRKCWIGYRAGTEEIVTVSIKRPNTGEEGTSWRASPKI